MSTQKQLTHVAGTFVIQADGAFLNGAGVGQGEDRTTTVPKTLFDGKTQVPYVSSQAWRRWLRTTLIEETGWEPSEIRAIKFNSKGNTSKISGEVNPVDFAEDDLFGYMRTASDDSEAPIDEEATSDSDEGDMPSTQSAKVKSVMRPSPFASSLLVSIRRKGSLSVDKGYVYPKYDGLPKDGTDHNVTPLPYSTKFYVANMQAVFCLDYHRLGVFRNVGDRIELAEEFVKPNLKGKKISVLEDLGARGQVYEMTDASQRKTRASELLKALAVLRGGAKQAQFGTSVAPNVIIAVGLTCGNPIFNHLFTDETEHGIELRVETLREVINEFADRIVTPVYVGIRKGFLANETAVYALAEELGKERIVVTTPRVAMAQLAEQLP